MENPNKKRKISENEFQVGSPTTSAVDYKQFFTLQGAGRNKVARGKECVGSTEIKMTDSNTSGLRRHLLRKHEDIYERIFPESSVPKKTVVKSLKINSYFVSLQ